MAEPTPDLEMRTHAWVTATGGALTPEQKRRAKAGIRAGYADVAIALVAWPFRRSRADGELPTAPDSRLARTAEEAALDQGPALAGHAYRTWVLGTALAQHDGVSFDHELFYVASLLHDSGMATQVVGQDFTVRSGDLALDVCRRSELDAAIGTRVADAIVSHATPGLSVADEPIGFYVQEGALADLAAIRRWDLPRGFVKRAYAAHPSCGVHREVAALVAREARDVPDGRFALLKRGGLNRMVQLSPNRRL